MLCTGVREVEIHTFVDANCDDDDDDDRNDEKRYQNSDCYHPSRCVRTRIRMDTIMQCFHMSVLQ